MSKRIVEYRTQTKAGVGKVYGRTKGPLEWSPELGRKTTVKIRKAIAKNKERRAR